MYETGIAWDEIYELGLRDIQAWFKDKFSQIMTTINREYEFEISNWKPAQSEIAPGLIVKNLYPEFNKIDLLSEKLNIQGVSISANVRVKGEYKTEDGKAYFRWDPE
jgi:hypothetical protein